MNNRYTGSRRRHRNKNSLKIATLFSCMCLCIVLIYAAVQVSKDNNNKKITEAAYTPTSGTNVENATQQTTPSPTQAPGELINSGGVQNGPNGFKQLAQYTKTPARESLSNTQFYADCLFIGDSITHGLIGYSNTYLGGAFSTNNVCADVGMSTKKILNDNNGIKTKIKSKNPKKIFILLGGNDLNVPYPNYDAIISDYISMVKELKQHFKNATIIVQITFPIGEKYEKLNGVYLKSSKILEFDEKLKVALTENEIYYIDINQSLKDENGYLKTEFSNDGMHFKPQYYAYWMNVIREIYEANVSNGILK